MINKVGIQYVLDSQFMTNSMIAESQRQYPDTAEGECDKASRLQMQSEHRRNKILEGGEKFVNMSEIDPKLLSYASLQVLLEWQSYVFLCPSPEFLNYLKSQLCCWVGIVRQFIDDRIQLLLQVYPADIYTPISRNDIMQYVDKYSEISSRLTIPYTEDYPATSNPQRKLNSLRIIYSQCGGEQARIDKLFTSKPGHSSNLDIHYFSPQFIADSIQLAVQFGYELTIKPLSLNSFAGEVEQLHTFFKESSLQEVGVNGVLQDIYGFLQSEQLQPEEMTIDQLYTYMKVCSYICQRIFDNGKPAEEKDTDVFVPNISRIVLTQYLQLHSLVTSNQDFYT